jgi:hypothetical protein
MNAPSSRRVGFLSSGPKIPRFRLGTPCSTRTRYDPWIYHEADPITSVATTNFSSSSLGFVDTLRQANFLTGGDAARRLARAVRWGDHDRRKRGEGAAALDLLAGNRAGDGWSWDRQNRDSLAPDGSSTTPKRCE